MSKEAIASTGKVLGALLYFPPQSESISALIPWLQGGEWVAEWPFLSAEAASEAEHLFKKSVSYAESFDEAFQRLFVGPYALPAPPWGSVYLDRESVLFGDSTLNLRKWMRLHGIETHQVHAEPEDHIGLMLMMSAWLAENSPALLEEFLATHLFPWAFRCLTLLEQGAVHPFYQGIAQLTQTTLAGWKDECSLAAVVHELYR